MTKARWIRIFRYVASIEGWSYVVLLFVAMPLKYWAEMDAGVALAGRVHGGLFIAYIATLFGAAGLGGLSSERVNWALLVSLLPFGTFLHDPYLKREEQDLRGLQQEI
ncbi:DUF3817 domain-containing protein [Aliiroseovarius crassostreae]|uniref:DUF3817 domain-containing protein n=1 Tax=Aliiroseovarius crassostreae TaxID=154981 RepID=UPI0021FB0A71|nr:DUF3817 domain-containing protein [Aliiroseovarius crassostreae]UWQ05893.1 DUF3817 domain-containing protein [Aliiroseovarius crassostreae]